MLRGSKFVGTIANVSPDGGFAFILRDTLRRSDSRRLGMEVDEDIFVHTRSGVGESIIPLVEGKSVAFLLGPNERHPGKLRAYFVEEIYR